MARAHRASVSGVVAFGCALTCSLASPKAVAETGDAVYLSNDASLMSGAVTASVRDIGAVWYNPAGLGGSVKTQLSLSGMVYGIRLRTVPGALRTTLPGGARTIDLASSDIFSAPHVTAYARRITDDVSMGVGIYVTERDTRTSSNTDRTFVPRGTDGLTYDANVRQHLSASSERAKYQAGPAIGWRLTPTFRLGASVFATYAKTSSVDAYEVDIEPRGGGAGKSTFVLSHGNETVTEVGLVANVGLQWDVAPSWHLGMTLRTPELRIHQSSNGDLVSAQGSASPGSAPQASLAVFPAPDVGTAGVRAPPRIVIGASHELAHGILLSAEGDLQPAVRSSATNISTRTVVNARLGARIPISNEFVVGVGAFTDRDQRAESADFTSERIDRFGGTAGCTLLTPFALAGGHGDTLVLATTVSLRYAAGVGEVSGLDLDLLAGGAQARSVRVVYHELLPYIGTSISF